MFRRLALAFGLLLSFAAVGAAQTADDIVAKSIAAQGLEKLKSVQTRRMTGTMTFTVPGAPGMEAAIVIENKRPAKTRATLTIQGTENIQAYDGENGWTLMPAEGKPTAGPANPDELKDLRQQADMDGELVDYKAKGHTIELVGKEAVQGTDAWKLKVTLKDGDVQYQYFDAEHFLPIKMETTRTINGAQTKTETLIGDYKDEGGVMMPHSLEVSIPMQGATVTQKIVVTKVEVNMPLDDALFKMPAVK
jgi:outer membrane lipoprotein-sorting protein